MFDPPPSTSSKPIIEEVPDDEFNTGFDFYDDDMQQAPIVGTQGRSAINQAVEDEDQWPLLEELGFNFEFIWKKTIYVLLPQAIDPQYLNDGDVYGPITFCTLLGTTMFFAGKIYVNYIYGFAILGCVGLYLLVNLMASQNEGITLFQTISIAFYCMLPIVLLSCVNVFFDLKGRAGFALSILSMLWCTTMATRFIEAVASMRPQRYLLAYPLLIFYGIFTLITVF
jgi:hypothetical protein